MLAESSPQMVGRLAGPAARLIFPTEASLALFSTGREFDVEDDVSRRQEKVRRFSAPASPVVRGRRQAVRFMCVRDQPCATTFASRGDWRTTPRLPSSL